MTELERQTFNRNIAAEGRAAAAKEELTEARQLQSTLANEGISVSRQEARELVREQKADDKKQQEKIMELVRSTQPPWTKDGGLAGNPKRVEPPKADEADENPGPSSPLTLGEKAAVPALVPIAGTVWVNGTATVQPFYSDRESSA